MMEWAQVIPLVAVVFGALVSTLLGVAITKLSSIETKQEAQNSKLFSHLTQSGIHESAVARIDERIAGLLKVVEVAHERIDSIKGRG